MLESLLENDHEVGTKSIKFDLFRP